MIVFDTSAWLEFFADGPHGKEIATRLRDPDQVLTPTLALYETYKWIRRERSEEEAIQAIATMKKTQIVELTDEIALTAADLSLDHNLPMADSVMLATAQRRSAALLTTDVDFQGIEGVMLLSKKRPSA